MNDLSDPWERAQPMWTLLYNLSVLASGQGSKNNDMPSLASRKVETYDFSLSDFCGFICLMNGNRIVLIMFTACVVADLKKKKNQCYHVNR